MFIQGVQIKIFFLKFSVDIVICFFSFIIIWNKCFYVGFFVDKVFICISICLMNIDKIICLYCSGCCFVVI